MFYNAKGGVSNCVRNFVPAYCRVQWIESIPKILFICATYTKLWFRKFFQIFSQQSDLWHQSIETITNIIRYWIIATCTATKRMLVKTMARAARSYLIYNLEIPELVFWQSSANFETCARFRLRRFTMLIYLTIFLRGEGINPIISSSTNFGIRHSSRTGTRTLAQEIGIGSESKMQGCTSICIHIRAYVSQMKVSIVARHNATIIIMPDRYDAIFVASHRTAPVCVITRMDARKRSECRRVA